MGYSAVVAVLHRKIFWRYSWRRLAKLATNVFLACSAVKDEEVKSKSISYDISDSYYLIRMRIMDNG